MSFTRKLKRTQPTARNVHKGAWLVDKSPKELVEIGHTAGHLNTMTEMLIGVIKTVENPCIWIHSQAESWRVGLLRSYLLSISTREHVRIDELLWQAIGELRDAIKACHRLDGQLGQLRSFDPYFMYENARIEQADDLRTGIRALLDDDDQGEALMQAIEKWKTPEMEAQIDAMKDTGRRHREHGIQPLTRYILDETKRLKMPTRGLTIERFLEELRKLDTVQRWIENPDRKNINQQPLEVQAYERFDGLSLPDANRLLKDIMTNEKRRQA